MALRSARVAESSVLGAVVLCCVVCDAMLCSGPAIEWRAQRPPLAQLSPPTAVTVHSSRPSLHDHTPLPVPSTARMQSAAASAAVTTPACAWTRALPVTVALATRSLPQQMRHNSSNSMVHARALHAAARSRRVNAANRIFSRPSAPRPSAAVLSSSHAVSLQHGAAGSMQNGPIRPFGSSSRLQSALSGLRSLLSRGRSPSSSPLELQLTALLTHQLQHADQLSGASSFSIGQSSASLHTSTRSPKEAPPFPFKSSDAFAPPAPVGNLGPTPSSKAAVAALGLDHQATTVAAGGGSLPPPPPSHANAPSSHPPPHGSDSAHHVSGGKDNPHSHTYASQAREITSALLTTLSHSSKAQLRKMTLIVAGVLGLGAFLIYIFRDPLKGHLSEQTADVAKRSLTSSEVQMQVNVLSADVVRQLLDNPAVMAQCSAFVSRLMANPETRAAVVQLLQATANDPQSLVVLSRLSSQLLADLMAKPETLSQLTQLLRAAITTPGNEQALQILFKNFAADPKTQEMVADLAKRAAMDTLHDANVQSSAKQFMKDVTADQAVQKSTGDAMWNAIKYSLKPNWMSTAVTHVEVAAGTTTAATVTAEPAAADTKAAAKANATPVSTGLTADAKTTGPQTPATVTPGETPAVVAPAAVVGPAVAAVSIHPADSTPSLLLTPAPPPVSPPSA